MSQNVTTVQPNGAPGEPQGQGNVPRNTQQDQLESSIEDQLEELLEETARATTIGTSPQRSTTLGPSAFEIFAAQRSPTRNTDPVPSVWPGASPPTVGNQAQAHQRSSEVIIPIMEAAPRGTRHSAGGFPPLAEPVPTGGTAPLQGISGRVVSSTHWRRRRMPPY